MSALRLPKSPIHNPDWLKEKPIAHRALHDASKGIMENSVSAIKASIKHGFPFEVDLQPSSDRVAMVFHDYELARMTEKQGRIRTIPASKLETYKLSGTDDQIAPLRKLLDLVNGQVGIVLELKGLSGKDDGFVEAVADDLKGYNGPVVVMSFNHDIIVKAREIIPDIPTGLTAEGDDEFYDMHCEIAEEINADFVSYQLSNLESRFVKEFRKTGRPLISWTVRSPEQKRYSDKFADQPTFEGFIP